MFQETIAFWRTFTTISVAAGVAVVVFILCLVVLLIRQREAHPEQPRKVVVVPTLTQEDWDRSGSHVEPNLITQLGGAMQYEAAQKQKVYPQYATAYASEAPLVLPSPQSPMPSLYEQESELPPKMVEVEGVDMFPDELEGYQAIGKQGFTAREWVAYFSDLAYERDKWQLNSDR